MMLLHLSYNEIILMQMKYFIFRIYDLIYDRNCIRLVYETKYQTFSIINRRLRLAKTTDLLFRFQTEPSFQLHLLLVHAHDNTLSQMFIIFHVLYSKFNIIFIKTSLFTM